MSKTAPNAPDRIPELRSYGRRRGRKRSPRQDRIFEAGLDRYGIVLDDRSSLDPCGLFPDPINELCLEIGFGGGEHLVWQANQAPQNGFIGAEPFEDGVVKVLTAIEDRALRNVRVWPGDARVLLRALPNAAVSKVFMLFPDPWPKKRHVKRRLFSNALLDELSRVMTANGELRVATDIAAYACGVLHTVQQHPKFFWKVARPNDWRERSSDWPATRYEEKARRAKRQPMFFRFQHQPSGKSSF